MFVILHCVRYEQQKLFVKKIDVPMPVSLSVASVSYLALASTLPRMLA